MFTLSLAYVSKNARILSLRNKKVFQIRWKHYPKTLPNFWGQRHRWLEDERASDGRESLSSSSGEHEAEHNLRQEVQRQPKHFVSMRIRIRT